MDIQDGAAYPVPWAPRAVHRVIVVGQDVRDQVFRVTQVIPVDLASQGI